MTMDANALPRTQRAGLSSQRDLKELTDNNNMIWNRIITCKRNETCPSGMAASGKQAKAASGTIENLKEVKCDLRLVFKHNLKEVKCALAEWPPRASNGTLASIEIPMEMKHTG